MKNVPTTQKRNLEKKPKVRKKKSTGVTKLAGSTSRHFLAEI